MAPTPAPTLPPARHVDLPGRGRTFVREVEGPPGAPTVLLLHGWCANADVNWWATFGPLGERFRVIALDHRGHSRGLRDGRAFSLEDCADDAAALLGVLGVDHVVAVGYSLGGAVAQLLWQRHTELVRGLVLCATSRHFNGRPRERGLVSLLDAACRAAKVLTPAQLGPVASRVLGARRGDHDLWAWAEESLRDHDWLRIIEAGQAICRFDSRPWAAMVDVPTHVLVTLLDRVVPPSRQLDLAAAIPGARIHLVDSDHAACAAQPADFARRLVAACSGVVDGLSVGATA